MCQSSCVVFFFKQKTAYEMRISDWSSDVCSSDLRRRWPRTRDATSPSKGRPGRRRRCGHRSPSAAGHGGVRAGERGGGTARTPCLNDATDRQSVGKGKSVSVRVDLRGRRSIKKKIEQIVIYNEDHDRISLK